MSVSYTHLDVYKRQKLDKFFNKVIPDVIKLLVAPMLTVFISTVLLFTLVGPAGRILSNGITDGLMWSTEHLGAFGYALFAGVQPVSYTHLDVYKRQALQTDSAHNYFLR